MKRSHAEFCFAMEEMALAGERGLDALGTAGGSGGGGGAGGAPGGGLEGAADVPPVPPKQLRRKSVSFTGDESHHQVRACVRFFVVLVLLGVVCFS